MSIIFDKILQDETLVIENFGGVPGRFYAAVYDGHGGRAAVEYIKKNLHDVRIFLEIYL